jgi:hypothetical protein
MRGIIGSREVYIFFVSLPFSICEPLTASFCCSNTANAGSSTMFVCARLYDVYLFMFFLVCTMFCVSSCVYTCVMRVYVCVMMARMSMYYTLVRACVHACV